MHDWKAKRLEYIDLISRQNHWTFGDNNPFFDEVWNLLPNTKAKNLKEFLKEKEEYEKRQSTTYNKTNS